MSELMDLLVGMDLSASAIGEATSKADPAILATVVGMGVSPGLVP